MKRILILAILLMSSLAWAGSTTVVVGQGAGGGASTYLSMWDGDQGDSDVLEYAGGVVQGTVTGGAIGTDYGQTGNGYRKTAHNQRILWSVSDDLQIKDDVGTIWISIRPGTINSNTVVFEAYSASSETIYIRLGTDNTVTVAYRGANVVSTDTVTADGNTWNRIGYAYDAVNNKHAVKIGTGSWKEESENITDMTSEVAGMVIGEAAAGATETTTVDIDDLYVMSTYQGADPL